MHRRFVGGALLLASIVLLSSLSSYAQDPKKTDTPVDSAKLTEGEFIGILKMVPGSDRVFTLEVQTTKYVPLRKMTKLPRQLKGNTAAIRSYNNALNRIGKLQTQIGQAQTQMANAKNPRARQSAANKLNGLSNQLNSAVVQLQSAAVAVQAQLVAQAIAAGGALPGFKPQLTKQTIEFQAVEEVKVRIKEPPKQFDDKGNAKKYTKAELAEMKGKDKKLEGYESSLEKLEVGQKLKVTLATVKKPSTPKDKAKDKDADKDKDAEKDKEKDKEKAKAKEDEKTKQVKMIMILEEVPENAPKGKKDN